MNKIELHDFEMKKESNNIDVIFDIKEKLINDVNKWRLAVK